MRVKGASIGSDMVNRKPYNINLDEELMRAAKKGAIDFGQHLYQFVEEAIQLALMNCSTTDIGKRPKEKLGASRSNRRQR